VQRPLDRRAGGDVDHSAVAHQGGIERHCDVARRGELAEPSGKNRIASGERLGERCDSKTRF
jgi:hypothetical protein